MPRAGLTPSAVIDAALAIVDEDGVAALSLASVAARTGVATPSLYKHVDGLPALRREIRLRVTAELGDELAAAVAGLEGEPAVRALAHAYRRFVLRHPHRFSFHQVVPPPEDTRARALASQVVASVAAALAGYRLSEELATHAIRCVRAAVQGFASLETAGGFGLPLDVDASFEHLVDMLVAGLAAMPRTG